MTLFFLFVWVLGGEQKRKQAQICRRLSTHQEDVHVLFFLPFLCFKWIGTTAWMAESPIWSGRLTHVAWFTNKTAATYIACTIHLSCTHCTFTSSWLIFFGKLVGVLSSLGLFVPTILWGVNFFCSCFILKGEIKDLSFAVLTNNFSRNPFLCTVLLPV